MAANYRVVSQEQTVQVLGPQQVLHVMEVGFVTIPSDVFLIAYVPMYTWRAKGAGVLLDTIAMQVEAILNETTIVAARYEQDADQAGLMASTVVFTVRYEPPGGQLVGDMEAELRIPFALLTGAPQLANVLSARFDQVLSALKATAEL